jgi:hypothetical protein
MPPQLGPICDRIVWGVIRARRYPTAHSPVPTVAFRSQYQAHYRAVGEDPPPGAKSNAESTEHAAAWWRSLSAGERHRWSQQMGVTIE